MQSFFFFTKQVVLSEEFEVIKYIITICIFEHQIFNRTI